jgi:hypothetical protein
MADKTLTQAAYDTDNIQNQADQVKGQATALKTAFDKTGNDAKTYNNSTLIVELQSQTLNDSGAHAIGLNTADTVATNVADELALIRQAGSGTIPPDGSITDAKLATDVKVGSLASLDTTVKTDVVSAINEDVENLDILRIAELDTGAANAYVVTTAGTFSRVDGNTLPFIPANNNTGASTINEDGNGVATIQKYVDGAWVALEEGDLKKFQQVQLVWNASESAFQLAPKGGAVIKSIQRGTFTMTGVADSITISEVDLGSSVVLLTFVSPSANSPNKMIVKGELTTSTNLNLEVNADPLGDDSKVQWTVVEFNNVKSLQTGQYTLQNDNIEETVAISEIDTNKALLFVSFNSNYANISSNGVAAFALSSRIVSTTSIGFEVDLSNSIINWQVVEFN